MRLSTFELLKNSRPEGGFTLNDNQLHTLQDTLFSMLCDISSLAEENGIPLYLSGGTVLGAVRHGDFIPWDDDLDVNLERRYYDRFFDLLRRERGEVYWLHTPEETPGYGILSSRIRLKGTDVRQREDNYSEECGACVDLFPIENTYDHAALRKLHGLLCMGMGFLLSCRKFYRDRDSLKTLFSDQPEARRIYAVKSGLGFLVSWGSVDFWTYMTRKVNSMCHDDHTRLVTIPAGRGHFSGEIYDRESFCADHKIMFRNRAFLCTSDPDAYMKALYGDSYMQLPPPEKREKHIFFRFSLPDNKQ